MASNRNYEYINQYSFHHSYHDKQKLKSIENFIDDILLIEDVLGFQKWLDDYVAKILNSEDQKIQNLIRSDEDFMNQIAINHSLFRKNWISFCSAYEMGLSDEYNVHHSIMRTVHESILLLAYLATHEHEAKDIKLFMEKKYNQAFGKFDEKHRKIKNFEPSHIRNSIFTDEMKESMNKIYGGLSIVAHPNIYQNAAKLEKYDPRRVNDSLWFLLHESFYNIIYFIENFRKNKELIKMILNEKIFLYIEDLKKKISKDGKIPDFFPNKNNLGNDFVLYKPRDSN